MATFDSTLNVVPTQTTATSPAIIDTSALAVAKLAESFTGQFLQFKDKEKKDAALDAKNKVLSDVAVGITKLGTAAESGQITLTQARVQRGDLVAQAMTANPSLAAEITKISGSASTNVGLSTGKTQAQIAQDQKVALKKDMVEIGWVSPEASESEVNELAPKLQAKLQSQENLKVLGKELTVARSQIGLETEQEAAVTRKISDKMKNEVRTIAVSEHGRIAVEVQRLNRTTGTDTASVQSAVEQLDALEDQLRSSVSGTASAFLKQDDIDDILAGVLEPIAILKQRFNEGKASKWATFEINKSKSETDVEFLSDPINSRLSAFSRNIGQSVLATQIVENQANRYIAPLMAGKGGTGTQDVTPKTKQQSVELIKEGARQDTLKQEDQDSLSKLVSGTLKDVVTDDAQGRVNSPKDIATTIEMLADPAVNKKVASGEIVLGIDELQRAEAVIRDQYLGKLVPVTNQVLNTPSPFEGQQSIGEAFDFNIENGVLVVNFTPEAKEQIAKANVLRRESKPFPASERTILITDAAKLVIDVRNSMNDMKQVVASANKAARAMATLNRSTKFEPILKSVLTGILGGEVKEKQPELPKKTTPDPRTEELIKGLEPASLERFNKLKPEDQSRILSMSPNQIQQAAGLLAPPAGG